VTAEPVEIHTDGACRGNPGPGGWGAVLRYRGQLRELRGARAETTNNRMELEAAVEALKALKRSCRVDLYTDSSYLRNGITQWLPRWRSKDWKTAAGKPVKNRDLWEALEQQSSRHQVSWHWVKGHSGDPGNERADRLANLAIDELGVKR
jgi:ribonuclease HI